MHQTVPAQPETHERGRFAAHAFRASAFLIAALNLAACAGTGASRAPIVSMAPEQPSWSRTQTALRDLLLSQQAQPQAGMPARLDPASVFYKARNFVPVWSGGAEQEEAAAKIRAILSRAHEQGLRDEEYKVAQEESQRAPGAEAAAYDLALTRAVLAYSRDVSTGRVWPGDIYDDVILPVPGFNAATELTKALEDHAVAKYLTGLSPPHPEYGQLALALARYRAIAEGGGWPSLPGQTEIKLEGKDSRLALLATRLKLEDSILAAASNPSADEFRDAVKRFQTRNGLAGDGRVGGETLTALNIPASYRVAQIAANMERWRWLPRFEDRYIAVNVPDQSLTYVHDGTAVLTSRVIVGQRTSPTPITRTEIVAVVANPPWNIPGDIAARDLLPHLVKSANYLASKHMVVTNGPPGDPYGRTIKWASVRPAEFPYAIRQLPGPATALGALMLDSPNDFDVYLHDTPNKKRFEASNREISNGCVRVQQILPLASLALTDDPESGMDRLNRVIKTHETQRLALDHTLPVYFLYWTAIPEAGGAVGFRPDRYGRDSRLIAALTKNDNSIPAAEAQMTPSHMESASSGADDPSP
jgi:murein L,D-transpeptidase YcbB/YkuD